ncbi:oxidoreductase [Halovivax sp.]|uniref:oxidoreductase n=1 Tax=Halovivax sp. TaxID=1935978 RepID=UPI0025C19D9B|nr:oxidoreductase [Halovivax sp.]
MARIAADVPDCSDRRAIVTGANSGIGFETAREFARNGATVVMACRSAGRGEAAADEIRADVGEDDGDGALAVERLDLASLDAIRAFAERVGDEREPIDLLINNAGTMAIPRRETADGFEEQFGVNHLGHFALTGRLLGSIADDGRVVTVSSEMHRGGELDVDDLAEVDREGGLGLGSDGDEYDRWDAYRRSKLANVLFAYELNRRLDAAGSAIASVAAHPGYADTALQAKAARAIGSRVRLALRRVSNALLAQSAAKGALPVLYAATAPDVGGGEYYGPSRFRHMRGPPTAHRSVERSYDRALARRLWEVSEELTGVEYDLPEPEGRSASPA